MKRILSPRDWLGPLLLVTVISPATAQSLSLSGPARVVDGDTLYVGDRKVRLFGIDGPESTQSCVSFQGQRWSCGASSKAALKQLVEGQVVTCQWTGMRSHDRIVARCTVAGIDIAQSQVAAGMALDFPKFSRGQYARDEQRARASRTGIHSGPFLAPWHYRQVQRLRKAQLHAQ